VSSESSRHRDPTPARCLYDRTTQELTIVVDTSPADADDISVSAGTTRVRIAVSHDEYDLVRTIRPPAHRAGFSSDQTAVLNNGVLTVTIGTTARQ